MRKAVLRDFDEVACWSNSSRYIDHDAKEIGMIALDPNGALHVRPERQMLAEETCEIGSRNYFVQGEALNHVSAKYSDQGREVED